MNRSMRGGTWSRARDLLAADPTKAFSAKEVADAIDAEAFEVRSVLALYAKRGKVVRVVTVENGPLRWRLSQEPPT